MSCGGFPKPIAFNSRRPSDRRHWGQGNNNDASNCSSNNNRRHQQGGSRPNC